MGQRLGQHFLKNPEVARRIVEALDLREGDAVVEVGAGRGELSREILQMPSLGHFMMIEKDSVLVEELARNFQFSIFNFQSPNNKTSFVTGQAIFKHQFSNTQHVIIEGDALQVLPEISRSYKLKAKSYKLIGNIPYYITGKLFRVIGELEHKPEVVVLMIQKEVAERVTALPPRFNLLAASVQAWAEVETLFQVSRDEFRPRPKVDSAVIRLRTRTNAELHAELRGRYYELVKILFKQPRKTILNNLSAGFDAPKEEFARVLQDAHVSPNDRPQTLSVELITKLARMLYNRL